jgi:hypothetical protein
MVNQKARTIVRYVVGVVWGSLHNRLNQKHETPTQRPVKELQKNHYPKQGHKRSHYLSHTHETDKD